MASRQDTMMNPSIEELLDRAGSKFSLVTLSAKRARQINAYFGQLGEGLGAIVPPQVTSVARKPLSIAFEEIASDKIVMVRPGERRRGRRGRRAASEARRGRAGLASCSTGGASSSASSGGIAAYKAIEVCRRLVDAGAHVVPVMTRGATRFVGRDHVLGPGVRARAHARCSTTPTPSRTPAWARRADLVRGRPGHRPGARRLRRGHLQRPAHRHAAGHRGARGGVPGHAHRDVGAPGRAGEPRHAAPAAASTSSSPRRAAWPAATSARAAWPPRTTIVGRVSRPRSAPRRDLAGLHVLVTAGGTREPIDPVRFVGNRSSGKQGHALAAEAAARGAKVTLVTHRRPARAAGRRRRAGRDRRPDGRGGRAPRPRAPTSSSWRPPWPTSGPATGADRKLKKAGGVPEIVLEPTPDILAGLGARKPPGPDPGRICGRDRPTCGRMPRRKLVAKGVDLIVANDVTAPGAGFEHDTNQCRDPECRRH